MRTIYIDEAILETGGIVAGGGQQPIGGSQQPIGGIVGGGQQPNGGIGSGGHRCLSSNEQESSPAHYNITRKVTVLMTVFDVFPLLDGLRPFRNVCSFHASCRPFCLNSWTRLKS